MNENFAFNMIDDSHLFNSYIQMTNEHKYKISTCTYTYVNLLTVTDIILDTDKV